MRFSNLLAATVLLSSPLFATTPVTYPAGSSGAVTLDWQKFNDLWTKMQSLEKQVEELQNPEHLPPIPFTITRAAYRGKVLKQRVEVEAIFEVNVFAAKEWVKIPFLPSSVAVREALVDDKPAGLLEENGNHNLVLRGVGRHVLKTRFWLKSPDDEQAPQLQFNIPSTAITLLSMEFPRKNLAVTVEPSQGVDIQTTSAGTLITAAIPPTQYISMHWQKMVPEEVAGPAKTYVGVETLLTISEGSAQARWNLNYNVLHRGLRQFRVRTPENWNVTSISGEGLQEWKIIESKEGSVALIEMAYAKKGALTLFVVAERGLGEKEETIEVPRLQLLDVEREQGTIGVEARGAMELQALDTKGLNPVDPRELPRTTWAGASQPILLAYRYTKPFSLVVGVKRHPEVPVLTTTVDDANAVTLMTARGQAITHIRYQVRNHLKQFLSVRLPEGAELWSAFVEGQPVKPMRVEKGVYRIPLAKSQIDAASEAGFPVEIVYYLPISKFMVAGRRTTVFPVPDAPVSRVLWSMYLPDSYRFIRFGGDLEKSPQTASLFNAVLPASLAAHDLRSDAPAPGVREEKTMRYRVMKDINQLTSSMGALGGSDENAFGKEGAKRQAQLESDVLMNKVAAGRSGVFPVAFQVPASGQMFRFGQVLVVGESPRLSLWFVHRWVVQGLLLIVLGYVLYRLYGIRKMLWSQLRSLSTRIRPQFSVPYLDK